MPRTLLTWSDRAVTGRSLSAEDRGPVLRLVEHADEAYSHARILTSAVGEPTAQGLAADLRERGINSEVRTLPIEDPTDYGGVFAALHGVTDGLPGGPLDVCLSAGTPQMRTLWVILVAAGLLRARMLQVIPAAFVPSVHPHPLRTVQLDIEGFPEIRALREEVVRLRASHARTLVGSSAPIEALRTRLARVARANVPVLIRGETGTGKELAARGVHQASARCDGPFVAENCGAFSEGVLASELFGHERGAFTGAQSRRRGLFEQAHGGTLFLDEVAEMSPRVQVMLLRVLQEGRLRRVGAEDTVAVDVRVVAATHRDLRAMVEAGTFREDLYYRIAGATLQMPPLRDRPGDLEPLVRHFLREVDGPRPWPTRDTWAHLRRYGWPGNVRELRAEVVRWTVFCDDVVTTDDLSPELRDPSLPATPVPQPSGAPIPPLGEAVAALEQQLITEAMTREGSLSGAARALQIDRNTLKRKLARFGLR